MVRAHICPYASIVSMLLQPMIDRGLTSKMCGRDRYISKTIATKTKHANLRTTEGLPRASFSFAKTVHPFLPSYNLVSLNLNKTTKSNKKSTERTNKSIEHTNERAGQARGRRVRIERLEDQVCVGRRSNLSASSCWGQVGHRCGSWACALDSWTYS